VRMDIEVIYQILFYKYANFWSFVIGVTEKGSVLIYEASCNGE
jgi:hypothetical protein